MKFSIFLLTTLVALFAHTAQGYFYVPAFMNSLPFKGGMAYAQYNNSIYMFGGENATSRYTNDFYKLTQTSTNFTWEVVPQTNAPEGTVYGKSYITSDGQNFVLLGGFSNTTANQLVSMPIYVYNFASQTWTTQSAATNATGSNSTSLIYNREFFSASYDSNKQITYIFGGGIAGTPTNDLHVLDASFNPTTLASTPYARYGHTASVLSNGQLVVIGGVISGNGTIGLAPMNSVWVYDPSTSHWTIVNVATSGSSFPSTTSDHVAIVTSDDKIIIFGGDSASSQRSRQYLNNIAILDTTQSTWTWTVPLVSGIPPSRRSYAVAGLLDSDHLTVAFGEASNAYYNDINVYDIKNVAWLQSFGNDDTNGDGTVSKGVIAGVSVAAAVLLVIILFLLWKFQSYIRWLVVRIHNDIWKPRTGEPVWAETSRIVSQVFFLFIFAMFLYFVIHQAVDSPNVIQRVEYPSATVDVPDVRFCFDGFPAQSATPNQGDSGAPGVSCQTDNGYSCNQFIKPLDMSIFQPTFSDNLGAVNCFLFRTDNNFQLTSTSGANNGSRLLFTMFADQSTPSGRVHISTYPKNMDPNSVVYNLNDAIPTYLDQDDVLNWQTDERNDIEATNVFTVEPFTYSAMSYDIVDHMYLQPVGWNYVGFLPITNNTPEIETNFRSEAPNPNYVATHVDIGVVAVFPTGFNQLYDREVKMYTLLNALGFVGGIFGILIAVQTWLFGYRPRSPWGVIHRWSTGSRKQSLLSGLQQKFKTTDSGIPLVHPVHHRFSVNEFQNLGHETEAQRVSRVEERMQVLELLFKAYYVDDEVFRSLDNAANTNSATKKSPEMNQSGFSAHTTRELIVPPTEHKVNHENNFNHMFNDDRSSQGSLGRDDNSQLNLQPHVNHY